MARVSMQMGGTVAVGSTGVIEIVVDGAKDLYGAEVHLGFDASALQIEDGDLNTPGTQAMAGPVWVKGSSFLAVNKADNQQGTLDFAATLLGDVPSLQGRIVVASFTVRALKAAATEVSFRRIVLADRDGHALRAQGEALSVTARS